MCRTTSFTSVNRSNIRLYRERDLGSNLSSSPGWQSPWGSHLETRLLSLCSGGDTAQLAGLRCCAWQAGSSGS